MRHDLRTSPNDTPTFAGLTLTNLAALTTPSESWVGPSSTAGVYFKGGNVGIGTTTPNAALTVGSYAGVSGVPASILLGNWNTSTGYPQIVGTWNAAGTWGIGAADAAHQTLQIGLVNGANTASPTWNSGNGMNLYVNGNVGIGTTTPHSKLAVVGLPTSTAGLSSGDIWVDTTGGLNILKIV